VKYFFVSGESSGDYISSLIAKQLIDTHQAEIKAMGGKHLSLAGAEVVIQIEDSKVMGWYDVITHLPTFKRIMSAVKAEISKFQPEVVLLVDFGSFNLRLAKWCKKQGYYVVYFIPPKVWASRENRIESLRKYCDQIIVLFPFEKDYFESKGLPVSFHGYPLANIKNEVPKDAHFREQNELDDRSILAILPGSRKQELKFMVEPMLTAALRFPNYQICVSLAEGFTKQELLDYIPSKAHKKIKIIEGKPYQLLHHSALAIVTSGTATLECALLGTPMIVCYKTHWLNYEIAKRLIKVPYISLPNLLLSEEVVPELIQSKCKADHIYKEVKSGLNPTQLSLQRGQFCKIYDNLYNINAISSIAKTINDRG